MALLVEGQTLEEAIAAYNSSFVKFEYDLPELWNKRHEIGLPSNSSGLPVSSRFGNFLLVEMNADSFPWGYVYGLLNIDDGEKKEFAGVDSLLQMAMMNMSVFLPALLLIASSLVLPISYLAIYIYRSRGGCGGEVTVHNLLYQKQHMKILTTGVAVVYCLVIIGGVIEFHATASPLTSTVPAAISEVVKLGLQDFNKFFDHCITEIRYFLNEGLLSLLKGGVVTITEDFGGIILNITGAINFDELDVLVATLRNVTHDVDYLKVGLRTATDEVGTANLAITAISTNYASMRGSLAKVNQICSTLGILGARACGGIPTASDLPAAPSPIDIGFDGEDLLKNVEDLDISGMLDGYDKFNLSLITDLAKKSIPLDSIYDKIKNSTEEVQKSIDWEALNPVTHEFMEGIIELSESILQHRAFYLLGHLIRAMIVIPVLYATSVVAGVAMGLLGTYNETFPCPERTTASALGAEFLSKAQLAPLLFNFYYAILCGVLLCTMSVFSIVSHSIYTGDIIARVVDRVPETVFRRTLSVDIGSQITTVIMAERALSTCERDGGTLKALGMDVGDFTNITNILDEIEWPDIEAFAANIESKLEGIRSSAIPKHSDTQEIERYLNSLTLPNLDFSQLHETINQSRSITVGGTEKSLDEFADELSQKATAIRSLGIATASAIAVELDKMVVSIRNIQTQVDVISNSLRTLESVYQDMAPKITELQQTVISLFTEMITLGNKLADEAQRFLREAVIDVKDLLNKAKLRLRSTVFQIIGFLLESMFRCRVFYDMYTILSHFLYEYITSYLNGIWVSLLAICTWILCGPICWMATKFFMRVVDWAERKQVAIAHHETTLTSAI